MLDFFVDHASATPASNRNSVSLGRGFMVVVVAIVVIL
jgi:hypothetical protein